MISDQLLEEAGVLGEASVSEWPLFFVPLADDVLSLELDDSVSDLYLVCLVKFECRAMLIMCRGKTRRPYTLLLKL
jgi:hypothetical protein